MKISDLKSALSPNKEALERLPHHVAAFCAFMIGDRVQLNRVVAEELSTQSNQIQSASVATFGYAICDGSQGGDVSEAFRDGVQQLSGRKFFVSGRAAGFEIDGIALLGVAAGMVGTSPDSSDREWLTSLLKESLAALGSDEWEWNLAKAASILVQGGDLSNISSNLLRVGLQHALGLPTNSDERQSAWTEVAAITNEEDVTHLCVKRAVFDCAASALATLSVNGANVHDLCTLLEDLSQSLSHWTFEERPRVRRRSARKWHVDHEYHVQNLLWTVLKPVFGDLVDEESLPKTGQKTARYDLGIPSLHTIIEVKFMRQAGQAACAKIIEEVAADSALYLKHGSSYKRLIAFIWDDVRQTEQYRVLIDGLESIDGVEKAILLPRPQRMGQPTSERES